MPHRRSSLDENLGTRLAFAIFDLLATNDHLSLRLWLICSPSRWSTLGRTCRFFLLIFTLVRQAQQVEQHPGFVITLRRRHETDIHALFSHEFIWIKFGKHQLLR